MKKLTEESRILIENTLKSTDVYHVSLLNPNVIRYEIAPHRHNFKTAALRYNYLLNNIGLLSTINNYFSYTRRLFEYFANGNFANTLRQRVNITQTLIECNGKTAVPVHISIGIKENTEELDLDNFNYNAFFTVTHPGYTRASGSVFLNIPLRNVLIYIKKEHRVKFVDKPYLKKITSPEDLLPYYNSLTGEENQGEYFLDFVMPLKEEKIDYKNNLKIHPVTDTSIFKLKRIFNKENGKEDKNLHPMRVYVESTFDSFNKFCDILFSSPLTIYSDDINLIRKSNTSNFTQLLQEYFQTKEIKLQDAAGYLENHSFVPNYGKSAIHPSKSLLTTESEIYSKLYEIGEYQLNKDIHLVDGSIKTVSLENTQTVADIVKLNEYKGIVLVVKKGAISYIKRTYYEFLYTFTPTVPLMRTEDNYIQIINCSHPYWKDREDYKELIIPYSFFTLQ